MTVGAELEPSSSETMTDTPPYPAAGWPGYEPSPEGGPGGDYLGEVDHLVLYDEVGELPVVYDLDVAGEGNATSLNILPNSVDLDFRPIERARL